MKKETMYILGGVAVVGLAYYLFKKPTTTPSNSSSFANANGYCGGYANLSGRCGAGEVWTEVTFPDGTRGYRCVNFKTGSVK